MESSALPLTGNTQPPLALAFWRLLIPKQVSTTSLLSAKKQKSSQVLDKILNLSFNNFI